jgi:predicted lysophospholipase L1 biosynthesis ABC-type transport system permease subunit
LPLRVNEAGPFYNSHPYVGVARLADGVDVSTANTELTSLLARFPEWMPQAYTASFLQEYDFRIAATPLHEAVVGPQLSRALWLLLAAVTLMLAAAVANVANLFLARIEARRQEAAVRTALGASTSQMTAHYAAESLLVCGCAFVLAVALAYAAVAGLPWFAPRDVPRIHDAALGAGSIGLGAALALLIAAALALAPALAPALRRTLDIADSSVSRSWSHNSRPRSSC